MMLVFFNRFLSKSVIKVYDNKFMNHYYNENKVYEGDLKKFLVDNGVDATHIENTKNLFLDYNYFDSDLYYESIGKSDIELIDVSKIKAIHRFYCYNYRNVYECFIKPDDDRIMVHKLDESLSNLETYGLPKLKIRYENGQGFNDNVDVKYYSDDDTFVVIGDGCHRSLSAIMFGIDKIRAKVEKAKIDKVKFEKAKRVLDFYMKYNILNVYTCGRHDYSIKFLHGKDTILVDGFYVINGDVIDSLSKMIEYDEVSLSKYNNAIKSFLRKIHLLKINYHLEQYNIFNKKADIRYYVQVLKEELM